MDKLKAKLAGVQKHVFWACCLIVFVVGVVAWWISTQALAKQTATARSTIETQFKNVGGVSNSEATNEQIRVIKRDHEQKLIPDNMGAWKALYAPVEQEFAWPKVAAAIAKLGPSDEIEEQLRETYQNAFDSEFRQLYNLINVRREKTASKRPAAAAPTKTGVVVPVAPKAGPTASTGEGRGARVEYEGLVFWEDREKVLQTLADRYRLRAEVPTTDRVRLLNEDLGLYRVLLKVIKATNGAESDHAKAAVREITVLELGKDLVGRGEKRGPVAKKPGEGDGESTEEGAPPPVAPLKGDELLRDMRYSNEKGILLGAREPPVAAEFKYVPFRMVLTVDQLRVADLLVAAANSPIPIIINQVDLAEIGGETSAGAAGDAKEGGAGAGPSSASSEAKATIHGVIRLMNPPQEAAPPPADGEATPDAKTDDAAPAKTDTPAKTEAPTKTEAAAKTEAEPAEPTDTEPPEPGLVPPEKKTDATPPAAKTDETNPS